MATLHGTVFSPKNKVPEKGGLFHTRLNPNHHSNIREEICLLILNHPSWRIWKQNRDAPVSRVYRRPRTIGNDFSSALHKRLYILQQGNKLCHLIGVLFLMYADLYISVLKWHLILFFSFFDLVRHSNKNGYQP